MEMHKNLQELLDKNLDLTIIHCVDILRKEDNTMKKKLLAAVPARMQTQEIQALPELRKRTCILSTFVPNQMR